jgi:hypothetical protein
LDRRAFDVRYERKMRVFVTGGSGFVGGHLIEGLIAAGHEVRALARSAASERKVEAFGATAEKGDLHTIDAAAIEGCEAVIHCAAFVEEWGTREQFWAGNVDGTTRTLEAAEQAGAKRFIHVGTEAALFDGEALINIDEMQPYPRKQRFLYSESKAEAERRVLEATRARFATMSIRPRLVWGPRDTSVLPAITRMAKAGSFAWIDGGQNRTSTTHVDNLVHALLLALNHGKPGRAYFVADEGVRTIRDFLTDLAATQGVDLGEKSVPSWLARPLSTVVETAWRTLGFTSTPPMTAFAVHMMSREVTVNTERAKRELGYAPVIDVLQGLETMRAAYLKNASLHTGVTLLFNRNISEKETGGASKCTAPTKT